MPPSQPRASLAVLAAAAGSICVGTVPMLAVELYRGGMNPQSMLFWRYWIALLFLVPLALYASPGLMAEWRSAGRGLFLNAITLGALQTFTYFRAIQTLPSSVVVTIFFTYPMFAVALDQLVFGRKARWPTILAVLLIFAGVLLTGWPQLTFETSDPLGLLCAILTPVIFSIYIAIAYRFTRQSSAFAGASFIYFGLGCTFGLIVLLFGLDQPAGFDGWMRLVLVATVGGAIQIASFAYALPRLSASGYSIIVSLELVTVAILGVTMLGERLTLLQWLGVAIVVVGIIVERLLRRE